MQEVRGGDHVSGVHLMHYALRLDSPTTRDGNGHIQGPIFCHLCSKF